MVNVLDKVQPKNKAQLKSLIEYAFNHNIFNFYMYIIVQT